MEIFIPGNVPSLKNSKVKTSKGIFRSKTVSKYLQKIGVKDYNVRKKTYENYKTRPNLFLESVLPLKSLIAKKEPPYLMYFHFIRGTKHSCDFGNMCQIIHDLLVAHRIIEDDNMNYLIPFPMKVDEKWYSYNKDNPGVLIRI
jgi:hypothetical protein